MNAPAVDQTQYVEQDGTVTSILSELDHYRKQSEFLQKLNMLHQKMASVLDLPSMIETYSIWMMEHVEHDMVGYFNHSFNKMHMYCSCHGPQRRLAIKVTEGILREVPPDETCEQNDDFFIYRLPIETDGNTGVFAFIRKGSGFSREELELVKDTLAIIAPPAKRALDFEEIFSQARKDSLTGLSNRFVFEERIDTLIEQARRHDHPLTLAAMDLDHFKAVNDTMGHLKGDEVLQQVAAALQQQVRQTDLLVRMGGDEFLLVLPDTGLREAEHLVGRLCQSVSELNVRTSAGQLGVSIGLAQWSNELSKEMWLELADDILYQTKAKNKLSASALN